MHILPGHIGETNAYLIEDYPYGFTLRCQMKMWLEIASKGKMAGQMRCVTMTENPKTGKWNKPKLGIYSMFCYLYITEDNHIHTGTLNVTDRMEKAEELKKNIYEQLSEQEKVQFDKTVKTIGQMSKLTWKIEPGNIQRVI